jgi:hypothetical protein
MWIARRYAESKGTGQRILPAFNAQAINNEPATNLQRTCIQLTPKRHCRSPKPPPMAGSRRMNPAIRADSLRFVR